MTMIDCRDTIHPQSAVAAFAARTVEKAASLYRAWHNRRELYKLGDLNDRELADIGLSRSDLFVARDVPARIDPTVRLGALAEINRVQKAARCIS